MFGAINECVYQMCHAATLGVMILRRGSLRTSRHLGRLSSLRPLSIFGLDSIHSLLERLVGRKTP